MKAGFKHLWNSKGNLNWHFLVHQPLLGGTTVRGRLPVGKTVFRIKTELGGLEVYFVVPKAIRFGKQEQTDHLKIVSC